MTTQSILEKVARMLEITVDFTTQNDTVTRLVSCAEYIVHELSSQYLGLVREEDATPQDGKVMYSNLTLPVVHIVKVEYKGRKIPFKEMADCVKTGAKEQVTVTYTYCIKNLSLNTAIVFPPAFCEEVLALGVAGEYLYRIGMEKDATVYGEKYLTAVKNLSLAKKNILLPARRYL